jgi:hypothetical protein
MALASGLDHGLLFAAKIAHGSKNWAQIPQTLLPIVIFVFVCHSCYRCREIAINLRTLLVKFSDLNSTRDTRLVEHFSMQVEEQLIEFQPINLFTFDLIFLAEVLRFVLDYDIVFMQFYFG